MAFNELFKVGLRFAGKRRWELCVAVAPSRESVRAEEARRCGGVLGRLAPWLRCQDVAALDGRRVRIPGQYLPRSNISAHARSDRGVADNYPTIISCRGSAARSAVAHSKIVLQMPKSLECCAVPFRQAGLGFIGCLEEIEENIVRCFGIADFVVGKNKLPKIAAVERGRRSDQGFGETFRFRISVGIKRRVGDRAAARG